MARSPDSAVARFETAVDAAIDGDVTTLSALLHDDPDLIRARSTLVTDGDPPVHGATLLHYLAANGVESHRQRSPTNAVDVAKLLLEAGSDPNALCHAYGGQCTTMALLVSSTPPARAAQLGHPDIVALLIDAGEDPNRYNAPGTHSHSTPLHQAIAAGHLDVVKVLVAKRARLDLKDTIHQGTPLGWATYCDQPAIAAFLRDTGAPA